LLNTKPLRPGLETEHEIKAKYVTAIALRVGCQGVQFVVGQLLVTVPNSVVEVVDEKDSDKVRRHVQKVMRGLKND